MGSVDPWIANANTACLAVPQMAQCSAHLTAASAAQPFSTLEGLAAWLAGCTLFGDKDGAAISAADGAADSSALPDGSLQTIVPPNA